MQSLGTPRLRRSFWLLFTIWKGFILTLTVKEVFVESDYKPLEVIYREPHLTVRASPYSAMHQIKDWVPSYFRMVSRLPVRAVR